jgi:cephalosporin-C deacetylase-like acetyl esterase
VPASNLPVVMPFTSAARLIWPRLGHGSSRPDVCGFTEGAAHRKRSVADVTHSTDHKAVSEPVRRGVEVLHEDAANLLTDSTRLLLRSVTHQVAVIVEHNQRIISMAVHDALQALLEGSSLQNVSPTRCVRTAGVSGAGSLKPSRSRSDVCEGRARVPDARGQNGCL